MEYEKSAKVFKAFCDENRLRIIEMLQTGEKCACMLEQSLPICQSTISHHMKILIESGVVTMRKDKKWSYYSLSEEGTRISFALLEKILKREYQELPSCTCE